MREGEVNGRGGRVEKEGRVQGGGRGGRRKERVGKRRERREEEAEEQWKERKGRGEGLRKRRA